MAIFIAWEVACGNTLSIASASLLFGSILLVPMWTLTGGLLILPGGAIAVLVITPLASTTLITTTLVVGGLLTDALTPPISAPVAFTIATRATPIT